MRLIAVLPGVLSALVVCSARAEEPADSEAALADAHTLSREDIRHLPVMYDDPIGAIRTLPGVLPNETLRNGLSYRGQPIQDMGLLVDGWSLPIVARGNGTSTLNPMILDHVELTGGIPGARLGTFSGGLIQAHLRPLTATQATGSFSLDLTRASALVATPLGANGELGTITAAGRVGYADQSIPLGQLDTPTTSPRVFVRPSDFFLGYGISLGRHDLEIVALNAIQALQTAGTTTGSSIGAWQLRLRWKVRLENGWQLTLQPIWSTTTISNDALAGGPIPIHDTISVRSLGLRAGVTKEFLPGLQGEAGVEVVQVRKTEDVSSGTTYAAFYWNNTNFYPIDRQAAYAELRFNRGRFESSGGLRFERFAVSGVSESVLQPRLSAAFQATDSLRFKGGWGLFRQPFSQNWTDSDGNRTFQVLSIDQTSRLFAGAEQKLGPRSVVELQGFYTWWTQAEDGEVKRTTSRRWERIYGMELLLRRHLSARVSGWIGYMLSRSSYWDADAGRELRMSFDHTHQVSAVGSFSPGAGIRLLIRYAGISGEPRYSFDSAHQSGTPQNVAQLSQKPDTPAFHRVDVRLEKAIRFRAWQLTAYLDVANVMGSADALAGVPNYLQIGSQKFLKMGVVPLLGINADF